MNLHGIYTIYLAGTDNQVVLNFACTGNQLVFYFIRTDNQLSVEEVFFNFYNPKVPQKISEDQVSQKIHSKAGVLKIL